MTPLHSRRAVLAAGGTALLAGCGRLPFGGDSTDPTEPLPSEPDGWTHPTADAGNTATTADTGLVAATEAWRIDDAVTFTTPVVAGDSLFVAGGVRPEDDRSAVEGVVFALDTTDGSERWRTELQSVGGGFAGCAPTLYRGSLYVGHAGREYFYALDARTGDIRWTADDLGGSVNSPANADEGTVVFTTGDTVYAVDETGTQQWALGEDARPTETPDAGESGAGPFFPATPPIHDGTVFLGEVIDDRTLACSLATGDRQWTVTPGIREACVGGGRLLGRSKDVLVALSPADGSEQWRREVAGFGGVAATSDLVVTATGTGVVLGLDTADGTVRWRYATGDRLGLDHNPALADGTVYVTTETDPREDDGVGRLIALDADDGTERWTLPLAGDGLGGPAVHDGRVYCSTSGGDGETGALHAVGE
jgi:outer membrane protein assembly factor BamB